MSHNDELPTAVQTSMRSRLADAARSLATLDDEIAHIESVLDGLRSQRTQVVNRIQSYRQALAPHRKLPTETLGEIFVCATPMVMLPPEDYQREAPWNISLVCSKWRNVILATPAIWNDIFVMHNVSNSIYHRSITSPVQNALTRSGHSLIVFNVHMAAQTFLGFRGSYPVSDPVSTAIIPHKVQPNEASVPFSLYWDRHGVRPGQRSRDTTIVSAIIHAGSLTMLHINIPVPASDIEAIIEHAQSLDTLRLPDGHPFAISTLTQMSCGKLLPKLRILSCMLTGETQDAYFDMLESRRSFTCTNISTVDFHVPPEGLNRNTEREEIFKNRGWSVTVHTCT